MYFTVNVMFLKYLKIISMEIIKCKSLSAEALKINKALS